MSCAGSATPSASESAEWRGSGEPVIADSTPPMMRAVVTDRYGPVTELRLSDVVVPEPGRGQVRVRVHAAGVNPGDVFDATGSPWAARLAGGLRRPRRPGRGRDMAGVVDAVGAGVEGIFVGDAVFGEGKGSFAELCLAKVSRLAAMPAAWSFEEAAAVPIAGTTALQLLDRALPDPEGLRLLVIGAGGGIGTFLVSLAVRSGAEVVGVCSAAKRDLVSGLGAVEVLDYATSDVTTHAGRYDAIVDNVASHRFRELVRLLAPGGVLVTNSGTGSVDGGALGRPLRAALLHTLLRRPIRAVVCTTRAADLGRLAQLGEVGGLRPVIGATFPLDRTADAMALVAAGHATGKVVVRVRTDQAER